MHLKRIFTSLLLVGFLTPTALPLAARSSCPTGGAAGTAVVMPASHGDCSHLAEHACSTAACSVVAPAVRPTASAAISAGGLMPAPAVPVVQPVESYRTGPPTPPPSRA